MPSIIDDDLDRMRGNLLFDGEDRGRRLSRFWILLLLASVIATAGVMGDSTATVIGAMIVAPLMTPIMGTVLSIATGDRPNLIRSVLLVVAGAAAAIAVGYVLGLLSPTDITSATSSQVAARINPKLIDLVAALATGAVGAFAQCRSDVSDTLPGVAIAISLVPPLTVVGLTLEAGAGHQAMGALLLFLTNVAAILLSGLVVMAIFGVHRRAATGASGLNRRHAAVLVVVLVVVVAVPLAVATVSLARDRQQLARVNTVATAWAEADGWSVEKVEKVGTTLTVVALGPLPAPDGQALRRALDEVGYASLDVTVRLVPEDRVELPAG